MRESPPFNDTFLRACRCEPTPVTPVWFMRQAGRYMSEYRALREKYSLLEIARTPELAAQVTLQPINRFPFDAAIIFADILLPLEPMGCPFSFQKGEGPVIERPIRTAADIEKLRVFDAAQELAFVGRAIALAVPELRVPLIGFAGGPFTLASYMIEGGHSRHFQHTKALMLSDPKSWHAFMEKIATITSGYLISQIEAGAAAIQLFDSWVGTLSPADYQEFVFPYSQKILGAVAAKHPRVPRIHFGTGTSMLLSLMQKAGATVVGVDWQTPLAFARQAAGKEVAVQGNLDPLALFASHSILESKIAAVLKDAGGEPGHIFNLGHGILPETPVEAVAFAIEKIHALSRARHG